MSDTSAPVRLINGDHIMGIPEMTERPKVKLYVGIPSRDLSVAMSTLHGLMLAMTERPTYAEWILPYYPYDHDVSRARARIVHDFLKREDATHLLFHDADVSATPDVYRDMVGLAVGSEHCPPQAWVSTVYRMKNDFVHHVAGGVGLSILSRPMLTQMTERYAEELWAREEDGEDVVQLFQLAFTPTTVDANGRRERYAQSEDVSFRERWFAMGGTLYPFEPPPAHVGHHGPARWTGLEPGHGRP